MSDYSWIGPLVSGIGKGVNSYMTSEEASKVSQQAYQDMLDNLRERFGDYDALGKAGYQDLTANTVGPSALDSISEDPASRQKQLEAMAALEELERNGGLSLADRKVLNDLQKSLNRQNTARQKGLSNEYAARGQLGAGAQLAMDLQNNQDAAETANSRGESIAAQAQDRALQAILKKGEMARGMSKDEYDRKSEAAKAKDAIERWNASVRTDAGKYNNSVRGQAFDDELAKARGKTALTDSMNHVVSDKGQDKSKTTRLQGSYRNDLIDQAGSAWDAYQSDKDKEDSSGTSSSDSIQDDEKDY